MNAFYLDGFAAGLLLGFLLGALAIMCVGLIRQLKTADERLRASGLGGGLHVQRDTVSGAQDHE